MLCLLTPCLSLDSFPISKKNSQGEKGNTSVTSFFILMINIHEKLFSIKEMKMALEDNQAETIPYEQNLRISTKYNKIVSNI